MLYEVITPATAPARRRLLEAHRDGVRAHVAELQALKQGQIRYTLFTNAAGGIP